MLGIDATLILPIQRFVKNGFVRNVESVRTTRGHVMIEYAHNVLVTSSSFSYSRAYGVGGAGYGVCIQNRSSDITVENNNFSHLRHSVVLKEGACRTIIAYNRSYDWAILDPEVKDASGNRIQAGADMSLHGMYPHHVLFEGNVCHNIYYSDYWGPTGPKVTAFRNKTHSADSLNGIRIRDFSHQQNVIANEIPGRGGLFADTSCHDLYIEANVLGGNPQWNTLSSAAQLPISLYLSSAPDFRPSSMPFPPFGPDVSGSVHNRIPVEVLYDTTTQSARNTLHKELRPSSMVRTGAELEWYDCRGRRLGRMPGADFTIRTRSGKYGAGVYFNTFQGRTTGAHPIVKFQKR